MSDNTSIEWAESTWNPIRGTAGRHTCARISPGCDNCYAATMNRRGLGGTQPLDFGRGETLIDAARLDEKALQQPVHWKRPRRIFVCSMTDLFGSWVPDEWLDRIFAVMASAPQHTFIVLTKRAQRMRDYLSGLAADVSRGGLRSLSIRALNGGTLASWPLPNVWPGVTIESDPYHWRANYLRETPATVRWISAEPLLSGLPSLNLTGIDWLVAGGESGHKARPMHPDWARDLRDRCGAGGTAFFLKQWGEWLPYEEDAQPPFWNGQDGSTIDGHSFPESLSDGKPVQGWLSSLDPFGVWRRVGKHRAGRLLDGRTWDEYPAVAAVGAAS